ncbi:PRC-barrel domain protein [Methanobrevibacter cuticularis]|uniref:PRC-barrel domain protein n=1 Tax=Methanobrevibacter cuticularis TaxID=47311 RepID=A0A166FM00_9EURY|nr:PRC-barrel domain-containing protein [Methanobrevibacter cuticularis]KZX17818.1 PRC-barrel domain protein [Methanobrevibacter cuticularis]
MKMNDFTGMEVIDTEGQSVGKIDTVEFDTADGTIKDIIIKWKNNIFFSRKKTLAYNHIDNINDVVLLNVAVSGND